MWFLSEHSQLYGHYSHLPVCNSFPPEETVGFPLVRWKHLIVPSPQVCRVFSNKYIGSVVGNGEWAIGNRKILPLSSSIYYFFIHFLFTGKKRATAGREVAISRLRSQNYRSRSEIGNVNL